MTYKVQIESEKMKENQVRDHIDRASRMVVEIEQKKGRTVPDFEKIRRQMEQCANRDLRKGRI